MFAFYVYICGTRRLQIVEVSCSVQAALPGAIVMGTTLSETCGEIVRNHWKKKTTFFIHCNLCLITSQPERSLALQSQKVILLNAQSFAGNSSPRSEAWPFGVCCPKSDQITNPFRRGRNGSTTPRAEGSQWNSCSGTLAAPQSQSLQTEAMKWVLVELQGPRSGR